MSDKSFSRILLAISVLIPAYIIGIAYYTIFATHTVTPKTTKEFAATSVMITRLDDRSGGSGVIISSTKNESKILTNAHVCSVIKEGGYVRTDDARASIKYYQMSNFHDMCLITVNRNFKINTVLADQSPKKYDDSVVAGHPHLLPTIVTRGMFSERENITIVIGVRKCTPEENLDNDKSTSCSIFGGVPIIKHFEAQVISNTIQPGSSGSPVFDKDGKIAGLVFAGSGNFGYGHIVPYEYLVSFFEVELLELPKIIPNVGESNNTVDITTINWKRICREGYVDKMLEETCGAVSNNLLLQQ